MKSRASPSVLEVSPLVVLTTRVSGDFQLTALNLWIARRERARLEKLLTGISSVVSVSPLPRKGCEQVTARDQVSSEKNSESNQQRLLVEPAHTNGSQHATSAIKCKHMHIALAGAVPAR